MSEPAVGDSAGSAKPELVIFDFDGVVVDSEIISLTELQGALRVFGVDFPFHEVRRRFLGSSINRIQHHIDTHGGGASGERFSAFWYDRLFRRFEAELTLIDGITSLLDALEALDIDYCVASGGSFKRLGVAMTATGIGPRFGNRVYSADLVRQGKPAPDLFLLAAAEMDHRPELCLVIEDAPAGVTAARAAGMDCIGFVGGSHLDDCRQEHRERLLDAGARLVVDSLADLPISGLDQGRIRLP